MWRGFNSKAILRALKRARAAASTLQAAWRGHRAYAKFRGVLHARNARRAAALTLTSWARMGLLAHWGDDMRERLRAARDAVRMGEVTFRRTRERRVAQVLAAEVLGMMGWPTLVRQYTCMA